MDFICTMQCQLPFMLNLPTGSYTVVVDGSPFTLEVLQEQFAVHFDDKQFAIGPRDWLRSQFGDKLNSARSEALRTVVRHTSTLKVEAADLPNVSDEDVCEDMQAVIIGEAPTKHSGDKEGLRAEAQGRLDAMRPDQLQAFRLTCAQRRASSKMPAPDRFLTALNKLIRLYMQRFNDFFVEEVTYHQLASESPLMGVFVHITCDGDLVHNYGHVGKIPPIMRRPWQVHPEDQVRQFTTDLAAGAEPDPGALLAVRAMAFLERGATRSAIIEASAALDLGLTKKLVEGFKKKGMTDPQVEDKLKEEIRFRERGKKVLKEATGQSAADLDQVLWMKVVQFRDKYRDMIAHSDVEPTVQEATEAVQAFLGLVQRIQGISVT